MKQIILFVYNFAYFTEKLNNDLLICLYIYYNYRGKALKTVLNQSSYLDKDTRPKTLRKKSVKW